MITPNDVKRELHKLTNPSNSTNKPLPTTTVPKKIKGEVNTNVSKWVLNEDRIQPQWIKKSSPQLSSHAILKQHEYPPPSSARERLKEFLYNSDDEYESYLGKLSGSWTKDETDYLINLVLDLELRWPVIKDQYDYNQYRKKKNQNISDNLKLSNNHDDDFDDYCNIDEDDENNNDMGDENKRSVEDLKARFFSVLRLMSETKTPQTSTRFIYDPVGEAQKVMEAERRYEVQQSQDSTTRLRDLVMRVQEIVNSIDRQDDFPAANLAKPEEPMEDCTVTNFAAGELRRLESELITIQNLSALICKTKGTTTVSGLLRASTESLLTAAMNSQRNSVSTSGGADIISSSKSNNAHHKTKTSSVSGGRTAAHHDIGPVGQPNMKDLVEGVEKSLRTVLKDWNLPTDDPKKYFANSFAPPIPTQKTLEAYLALKVDAAVFHQLRKQRDQTQTLYDTWVSKLLDLRRGLRSSRRHQTSVVTNNNKPDVPPRASWTTQRR